MTMLQPEQPLKTIRKFRFSTKRLAGLKLPLKGSPATEWSDCECTGLRLIVSSTGRKRWYFRCLLRKKRICVSLGEFPAVSLQEARGKVLAYKNGLSRGIDPRDEIRRRNNTPSVREFSEEYYIPYITERKRTWREDVQKLTKDIYPALGSRLITDVSRTDLLNLIQKIKQRASGPTANRYLALLSRLFSFAHETEFIVKNPVVGLERFQESSGRERFLTDDEVDKLLIALRESHSKLAALALMLLLVTGMRKSEVLTLPWTAVDLDRASARLDMENTKGKCARTVILNEAAIQILNELKFLKKKGNPYVFPGKRNGGHLVDLRKTFLLATKKAGIEGCRIHDLRHTYCSKLASSGVSLITIARLVGHRTLRTTERYSHLSDKCLREADSIIGDNLCGKVGLQNVAF